MKILYQIPSLATIYAGRTIYYGYKNAFEDLGHQFMPLTADDDMDAVMDEFLPDIFITGLNSHSLRYLDFEKLKKHRQRGMKVLVNIPFWRSPLSKMRVNEAPSLKDNKELLSLVKSGRLGDAYYNVCEQGDWRMDGFEKTVGRPYHTVPLAADRIVLEGAEFDPAFKSDIVYIGTNLPEKRQFFKEYVDPIRSRYNVKLYGQDWTAFDRGLGWVQRFGQYFNIHPLAQIRKPKLKLEQEGIIYASTAIAINVHEEYQKKFGGDCNERTFKIPFCHGFEITDDVACISKYFIENEEMVIAHSKNDWLEKVNYFMDKPDQRQSIIEAGRARVVKDHTYHNRAEKMMAICKALS